MFALVTAWCLRIFWFVGMRKAMEMMITGDSINGTEAVALGWANATFPADELDAAVVDRAAASSLQGTRARRPVL